MPKNYILNTEPLSSKDVETYNIILPYTYIMQIR